MKVEDLAPYMGEVMDFCDAPFTLCAEDRAGLGTTGVWVSDFHKIYTILDVQDAPLTLLITHEDPINDEHTIIYAYLYDHELPDYATYVLIVRAISELVLEDYYNTVMENGEVDMESIFGCGCGDSCHGGCGGCGGE
jgi:hypothetical protein